MLDFKKLVLSEIVCEANSGPGTALGGNSTYNPTTATTTASVSGTYFKPDDRFQPQIEKLITMLYPGDNAAGVYKNQFTQNAIRLVSSGYQTISDTELNQFKKYWPIIDLGYTILSEIGTNNTGKITFQNLKTGTFKSAVTDINIIEAVTIAYDSFFLAITKNSNASSFKDYQNYRLKSMSGGKTGNVLTGINQLTQNLGQTFGKYFEIH
jgi:hypothetical protein